MVPTVLSLEVHTILDEGGVGEALGMFAMLIPGPAGNFRDRVGTVVTEGNDLAISISPPAFRRIIFCPQLPGILFPMMPTPPPLPPVCGIAASVSIRGVTLTSISDTFAEGRIEIRGRVTDSGFCFDAVGTFRIDLSFGIAPGGMALAPITGPPDVDVDIDIPFLCWFVSAMIPHALGVIALVFARAIGESTAERLATNALSGTLGGGVAGVAVPALLPVNLTQVNITSEGLTVNAVIAIQPLPQTIRRAQISNCETVKEEITEQEREEPFVVDYVPCLAGEYTVIETRLRRTVRCEGEGLIGRPFRWSIIYSGTRIPLEDESGTVILPSTTTRDLR